MGVRGGEGGGGGGEGRGEYSEEASDVIVSV